VSRTNFPLVVTINGDTFGKAVNNGMPVVIAAIKPSNSEVRDKMKVLARRDKRTAKFVYAIIDRVTFSDWLSGFPEFDSSADGYFVFDNDKKAYWVMEEGGRDLGVWIKDVRDGKVKEVRN